MVLSIGTGIGMDTGMMSSILLPGTARDVTCIRVGGMRVANRGTTRWLVLDLLVLVEQRPYRGEWLPSRLHPERSRRPLSCLVSAFENSLL